MNSHVIDPKLIADIKKLNTQIKSLRELRSLGLLKDDFKLTKKEIKLTKKLDRL